MNAEVNEPGKGAFLGRGEDCGAVILRDVAVSMLTGLDDMFVVVVVVEEDDGWICAFISLISYPFELFIPVPFMIDIKA